MACEAHELIIKDISRIDTNVKEILQDLKSSTIALTKTTESMNNLTVEVRTLSEQNIRHKNLCLDEIAKVKAENIVNYKENLKRIDDHKTLHTCDEGFDQKLRSVYEFINKAKYAFNSSVATAWHNILNTAMSTLTLGLVAWMMQRLK